MPSFPAATLTSLMPAVAVFRWGEPGQRLDLCGAGRLNEMRRSIATLEQCWLPGLDSNQRPFD
jgi:hypothetical protein